MTTTTLNASGAIATLAAHSDSDKHCVFLSGAAWFSVPAVAVREITIAPPLVKVPESDKSLAGLCHLRSEFVPVILLNSLLDGDACDYSQPHNKLLVIHGASAWGILIAEAAALESLETIVTPDSRLDEANHSPVMGTAMFRDQIVRVMDSNRIFGLAQRSLEKAWESPQQSLLQSRPE
ncbi:MAG: chemotaxis protein CheW [Rubripirellula sp.]